MSIKFDVKMTQKIMYNFQLHHAYNKIGIIILNICAIVVAILGIDMWSTDPGQGLMYLVVAIIGIGYTPISLYGFTKKQIKFNEVFKNPITYTFSEEGLTSSQNDVTTQAPWEMMVKVASTNKSIIVYTGKNKATILPKEAMGDNYELVVEMISTHLDPKKVKIKS